MEPAKLHPCSCCHLFHCSFHYLLRHYEGSVIEQKYSVSTTTNINTNVPIYPKKKKKKKSLCIDIPEVSVPCGHFSVFFAFKLSTGGWNTSIECLKIR